MGSERDWNAVSDEIRASLLRLRVVGVLVAGSDERHLDAEDLDLHGAMAAIAFFISSGVTSRVCVATDQLWP